MAISWQLSFWRYSERLFMTIGTNGMKVAYIRQSCQKWSIKLQSIKGNYLASFFLATKLLLIALNINCHYHKKFTKQNSTAKVFCQTFLIFMNTAIRFEFWYIFIPYYCISMHKNMDFSDNPPYKNLQELDSPSLYELFSIIIFVFS